MAYRFPSPTNAVLPGPTGILIGFARDPKEFALLEYVQLQNSAEQPHGIYHELDRDRPIRVVSSAEFRWADGDKAPSGETNKGSFQAQQFRCERIAYPWVVGEETAESFQKGGAFDPIIVESKACLTQAMTDRTLEVMAMADTAGAWGTYTASASSISGGGRWDAGTSTAPYFQTGLMEAARLIQFVTNNAVKMSDLVCVLSPIAAIKIRASAEMHDFIKGSPMAERLITGELRPKVGMYGLPEYVAGVKIVVENAVRVSTRNNADGTTAGTRGYLKSDDNAMIVSRAGGLEAPFGTKSFSTLTIFYHKYDVSVESRHESWDKRHEGRVIDYRIPKITAAPAGYYVTDILT
jgi:hypothetical protein